MYCLVSHEHQQHAPAAEWMDGRLTPYLETPARVEIITAALAADGHTLVASGELTAEHWALISELHDPDYLGYLRTAYETWIAADGASEGATPSMYLPRSLGRRPRSALALPGWYGYDGSGVITAGTWAAVTAAASCALEAAAQIAAGRQQVYALCRPPGHHAYRDRFGGYCFVNNAAAAAEALRRRGKRIALLDIDYHHGNGTQALFEASDEVLFVSLHGDPARAYPYLAGYADEQGVGAGRGFTRNLPLEAGINDQRYLAVLETACREIEQFAPDVIVISAGFDTYQGDPLGDFALSTAGFREIGGRIRAFQRPTLIVQEGGYAIAALGANVAALLGGMA